MHTDALEVRKGCQIAWKWSVQVIVSHLMWVLEEQQIL